MREVWIVLTKGCDGPSNVGRKLRDDLVDTENNH